MQCNACHRSASFEAKFTFAQRRPPEIPKTVPVFTVSFETSGGYCVECMQRMERMAKENNFTELIGPEVRQEVSIIFELRGWKVDWNGTVVTFNKMKEEDNNLSLPLDAVAKGV